MKKKIEKINHNKSFIATATTTATNFLPQKCLLSQTIQTKPSKIPKYQKSQVISNEIISTSSASSTSDLNKPKYLSSHSKIPQRQQSNYSSHAAISVALLDSSSSSLNYNTYVKKTPIKTPILINSNTFSKQSDAAATQSWVIGCFSSQNIYNMSGKIVTP